MLIIFFEKYTPYHGVWGYIFRATIHSYIKSNKVLLCSRCIVDGKIDKSKFKPITQVVKETRGSMNSFKLKLNQSLLQLKRFKEHIENIKDENRK